MKNSDSDPVPMPFIPLGNLEKEPVKEIAEEESQTSAIIIGIMIPLITLVSAILLLLFYKRKCKSEVVTPNEPQKEMLGKKKTSSGVSNIIMDQEFAEQVGGKIILQEHGSGGTANN